MACYRYMSIAELEAFLKNLSEEIQKAEQKKIQIFGLYSNFLDFLEALSQ